MAETPLIQHTIDSKASLAEAFLPFVRHGGLFIPMGTPAPLHSTLDVELQLPDGGSPVVIKGQVVWLVVAREGEAMQSVTPTQRLGMSIQLAFNRKKTVRMASKDTGHLRQTGNVPGVGLQLDESSSGQVRERIAAIMAAPN